MSTKPEPGVGALDKFKLALALATIAGGIVAYNYYPDQSLLLRVTYVLLGTVLAVIVAMQSEPGRELWRFIQGSRVELRKVVWPQRQETMQTTLAVIVFTLVMGVFFWLLDMVLLWATQALTGRGS